MSRARRGFTSPAPRRADTIASRNVLRDYLTDLFPILELEPARNALIVR